MIKHGTKEYFALLELQRDLEKAKKLNLGLRELPSLRMEVRFFIKLADDEYTERITKNHEQRTISPV